MKRKPEIHLRTYDDRNNEVIMHKKNWIKHSRYHPELFDKKFEAKMIETLKNPEGGVWESIKNKKDRCYYKRDYYENLGKGRFEQFIKVTVKTDVRPFVIKTAHLVSVFGTMIIRETKRIR